ncbi:hypothetical protein [Hydrogenophaga sp. 5NK40-0174]|uniref:hypothetical protein n=1 Tax=Hydrogenophaga sp. 5NK40-0174 TaxID=3127649 RepID=UPI003106267B
MTLRNISISLLSASLLTLAGCDMLADKAATEMLKVSLKAVCGEEDKACIAAVEAQFDACQEKYKAEWDAYVDAEGDDDALLDEYSDKITACIVDDNGDPYFGTADTTPPDDASDQADESSEAPADAEDAATTEPGAAKD